MRSPLTDFGQQNLAHLLRLRIWMVLGAFAVAFALQWLIPGYPLGGLLILISLELGISTLAALLAPRLASRALVHAILCLDVVTFTIGVFVTGGIEGGFSALYVWIVLLAALLLGLSSVPLYSLLVLCGFAVNVLLEFGGIRPATALPLPLTVAIMAQLVLLCMLLVLGYALARYRHEMAAQHSRESEVLEQSAREMSLLFDTLRATTSTLELDQVIARLLEKLVRAFDLTSAYFTLVDEANQMGTIRQEFFAEAAAEAERSISNHTYPLANSSAIRKMLTGISMVSRMDDPALPEDERRFLEEAAGKSVLRVPLRTADQVIGFLSLWETRKMREWTPREIRLVETIAAHTTTALANARSYDEAQRRTRELEALYAASQRLNASLSVKEICQVGVDSLIDGLGYDDVAIYFTTASALILQCERGYARMIAEIPIADGIMARAARTGHPVLVEDVSKDREFISAMPDVQSEISVPLVHDEQVFGVLNVEAVKPRRLSASDVRLLTTFANQLVIAFDNAHLFQEIQQRLAELETLHQASAAINADLTLDAVLQRVGEYFIKLLVVDTCTICRWDGMNEELYVLLDRDPDTALHVPAGTRFAARGIAYTHMPLTGGKPYVLNRRDPQIDPQLAGELDYHRWSTLLILPLLGKGKPIGIVMLGMRDGTHEFAPDEMRLAESLAGQAAIAIENARLYAQAAERLRETEVLYRFTAALRQTAGLESLGRIALDSIAQLVPFDLGGIALLDQAQGRLTPVMMSGPAAAEAWKRRAEKGQEEQQAEPSQGIVRWVVEHGEIVRLGDVSLDARYIPWLGGICAELCVPLKSGDRVIGAINLESKQRDAFDGRAEQLLVTFGNQLAIAIVNEQLHERTRQDAEVKSALLRELSHRVKNNLSAVTSLLQLALIEPPEAREQILLETLARVQSMVLAHALLARSDRARVNLVELGRQLLQECVIQLAPRGAHIAITARGEPVEIAPRQLTTVALILNELTTNAILHGLDGADPVDRGQLDFCVQTTASGVLLILSDNGKGLPGDFDLKTSKGLGLELIRTMAEKDLHGSFTLERVNDRTVATLQFAIEE